MTYSDALRLQPVCTSCYNLDPRLVPIDAEAHDGAWVTYPGKKYVRIATVSGLARNYAIQLRPDCHFCKLIASALCNSQDAKSRHRVWLCLGLGCAPELVNMCIMYWATNHEAAPGCLPSVPRVGRNALDALSFVHDQLQTCFEEHTKCSLPELLSNGSPRVGPRRLLQINTAGDSIRLITVEQNYPVRYVALSYCWGGDQTLKLTQSSQAQLSTWFPLSELARLHRDAITVCQRLGLSHLWIDALCIQQDNDDDWADQSAKAAAIYDSAFVTIQALACSNTSESLFEDRVDPMFQTQEEILVRSEGGTPLVAARSRINVGHHHSVRDGRLDPLARRAWGFQESAFSRRLISFSSRELQWRCRTSYVCECGDPADSDFDEHVLHSSLTTQQAYDLWWLHVQRYSRTELTRPSDYLVAISGLATKIADYTHDTYIAGIWPGDIARGLLWAVQDGKHAHSVDPYRAPSFSWASVNGAVNFPSVAPAALRPLVRVISSNVLALNKLNPLGEVVGAKMCLLGQLVSCNIRRSRASCTTRFLRGSTAIEADLKYDWDCDLALVGSQSCWPVQSTKGARCCMAASAGRKCARVSSEVYRLGPAFKQHSPSLSFGNLAAEIDICSSNVGVRARPLQLSDARKSQKLFRMSRSLDCDSFEFTLEVTCLRVALRVDCDLEGPEWLILLGPSPAYPGCYERLGLARLGGLDRTGPLRSFLSDLPVQDMTIF